MACDGCYFGISIIIILVLDEKFCMNIDYTIAAAAFVSDNRKMNVLALRCRYGFKIIINFPAGIAS